jgi:hypothetical protein
MITSSLGPFARSNKDLQDLVYYPKPEALKRVILGSSLLDRRSLVRLWLTEGIPYAFRECPGTYEEMREWLAVKLCVHAKDVTLVGSGRIGFSMKPAAFGRVFGESSDLDLTIVNAALFNFCVSDANLFSERFIGNLAIPRNDIERVYWTDNVKRLPSCIKKGFIDTRLFPGNEKYRNILNVNDAMSQLARRLASTPEVMTPKKVSVRIYSNWDSLVNRVSFNLETARKELVKSFG